MQFILCQPRRPEVGSRHWTAAPRVLGISAPQRWGTTSRLLYWDVREHLLKVSTQQDSDTQSSQLSAHPSTGKCFKGQFASAFFSGKQLCWIVFLFFFLFLELLHKIINNLIVISAIICPEGWKITGDQLSRLSISRWWSLEMEKSLSFTGGHKQRAKHAGDLCARGR